MRFAGLPIPDNEKLVPEIFYRNSEPVLRYRLVRSGPSVYAANGKRVLWVQDESSLGGAEISGRFVIDVGLKQGWSIRKATPALAVSVIRTLLAECDLVVLNNLWEFARDQIKAMMDALSCRKIPYVKYEHDHRELARSEFSKRLFSGSFLNVFLSPMHLGNYESGFGVKGICLPLAIDVDVFRPVSGIERKEGAALACFSRIGKVGRDLAEYAAGHPEIRFDVIPDSGGIKLKNVFTKRPVPHEAMPEIYSGYEYVVCLPDSWEAGGRSVFEGALCGCKVVGNEKVGHLSWGVDLSDAETLRKGLKTAPYEFWRLIGERLESK